MDNNSEMEDSNNADKNLNEDGGHAITVDTVTSAPLVFLRETSIFGFGRQEDTINFIKHEDMYVHVAVADVIDPSHILGLQHVNGLWRIV